MWRGALLLVIAAVVAFNVVSADRKFSESEKRRIDVSDWPGKLMLFNGESGENMQTRSAKVRIQSSCLLPTPCALLFTLIIVPLYATGCGC
jgi:hypothetical protein